MPLLHQDFRRFIDALDKLNPAQIEDAWTKIRDLRRKMEAISEIETRTIQERKCPFFGEDRRQKWGRRRTKIQRYQCSGCQKTYSGRTGSAIGRIRRRDLFMVVPWDMLGTSVPQSVRALAHQLRLNTCTVWRWRMLVFSIIGSGTAMGVSGIIEADETYRREPHKGSREWVRHSADPQNVSQPSRPRWEDFTTQGLKMMRVLSRWQLPILTVADRGGGRLFRKLPNRKGATVERAMNPLVPGDSVLCSDGGNGYKNLAAARGLVHFVIGRAMLMTWMPLPTASTKTA
ncbi:IS1595 family transposase [Loktanella salsilacus]|uniref:IS1595 family transposase n=1 Tax=Loktanella salsilacus TaxID=195913 RepID=UPI0020B6ADB9|nr:IS1595 family transposase [Loktanella salsilacus]UTH46737.1 IS1 family transposase [Loktanella salsilacus]